MNTRCSKSTIRKVHAWIGLAGAGALSLAACSDGSGPGRAAQPPPGSVPPPVVNPPAPAKPDIVLGAIAFKVGSTRVVLRTGRDLQVGEATTITANGRAADFDALRPGRMVLIQHERGGATARHIDAYDLLVGPLEAVDSATGRTVVLGQRVLVTGHTAVDDGFVQDGALAALLPGSQVAVSGHVTATGDVLATRIESVSAEGVLVRGTVRSVDGAASRLRIGGIDVDYGQATWDSRDFPAAVPAAGDEVIVRAGSVPAGNLLVADALEYVPPWLGATERSHVELSGLITRRTSTQNLDVAGRSVELDCDVYFCSDSFELLPANTEVRFSGWITSVGSPIGGLVKEDFYGSAVSLTGSVSAIDSASGALTFLGFRIQPTELTQWSDENGAGAPAITANDLRVGDTVDASGTYGGIPGLLLASSVRRVPAGGPAIRGWQFSRHEPSIAMLGRSILTDATTAVDVCGAPSSAATLFSMDVYAIEELRIELSSADPDPLRATRVTIDDGNC